MITDIINPLCFRSCYLEMFFEKKLFLKFTIKGKRYMELSHFFFSSTLSGKFRTLINIYDGAIPIDS